MQWAVAAVNLLQERMNFGVACCWLVERQKAWCCSYCLGALPMPGNAAAAAEAAAEAAQLKLVVLAFVLAAAWAFLVQA